MDTVLHTQRLTLRPFNSGDGLFILELFNTPGWLQNIGDRNIHTEEDAFNFISTRFLPHYEEFGYGPLLVSLNTGQKLGICTLIKRDFFPVPDIGYAVLPQYARQGYMYEACLAVINHCFTTLHMPELYAVANPDNLPSHNLLVKLGFEDSGEADFYGEKLSLFVLSGKHEAGTSKS